MRPRVRRLALILGCVALVGVVVILVGPRLLLRTSFGHRTVERVLTRILDERIPGSVAVGRLSGDVLTGLRADDVVVRNPDGVIIARAQYIAARWRPLALLRRRTLEELQIEHPVIALDRARWRTPPKRPQSRPHDTVIELISARDGEVRWKRASFTRVNGTATLHSIAHLDVHGVSGRVGDDVLHGAGVVGWANRPAWVAARFAVERPRRLQAHGDIFYTPGRLEADIEGLAVPAPVAMHFIGGRGALHLRAHVDASDAALHGFASGTQDGRSLRLGVKIDRVAHSAVVDGRVAGAPRPMRLHARVRYRPGTIVLSALRATVGDSRLDGSGALTRRHVQLALRLRLQTKEAKLLALRPTAPIAAELRAGGTLRALEVRGRAGLEAAQLRFSGRLDLPSRAGNLRLVARDVQPAHVIRGAPALTVSGNFGVNARISRRALTGTVRVAGGNLVIGDHRIDELSGEMQLHLAREGALAIQRLSGRWRREAFAARGLLRWNRRQIDVDDANLDFAGAHAHADAHYRRDTAHLALRAAPLIFSTALVSRILHHPSSRAWTGQLTLTGSRGDLTLTVDTVTLFGALRLAAHVLRVKPSIEVDRVEGWLGASHLYGALRYRAQRLNASLEELVLAPSLVHQLVPQLTPEWPIRLRGAVTGHQLWSLSLALVAGPSTAQLSGRIAARQFQLTAHLDNFDLTVLRPSKQRVRASLNVTAGGRFENGGAVGTLMIRDARGYVLGAPFFRGLADVRLDGRGFTLNRAAVGIPGAKLLAKGSGSLAKGLAIDFGVVITNALALRHVPQGLRTIIGINSMLPGRSVEGSITARPGQKPELKYTVLPIGLSQIEFLFRVLTGRFDWSQTRL